MISLVELKAYFKKFKIVNLFSLSQHFNIEPDQLQPILIQWERKGRICKSKKTNQCGTKCCKCAPEFTEMYEWQLD